MTVLHMPARRPCDLVPVLSADTSPPLVHGVASLAHLAYAQCGLESLLSLIGPPPPAGPASYAAWLLDRGTAHELHFDAAEAARLQAQALGICQVFRVGCGHGPARRLRVLALLAPGTLMVNTPLDFITNHLDVQLDLLFVTADRPLPQCLPDHDIAFCAVSECEPEILARLRPLCGAWPRPLLNHPGAIMSLSRDGLPAALAGIGGLHSAPALRLSRERIAAHDAGSAPVALLAAGAPLLIRPVGSHAGAGLERADTPCDIAAYVACSDAAEFFVTAFVDYRSPDGLYRKFRIAFIDGAPFLCHMAVSDHWMVHYLNAGMAENASRRADEARAMAGFDRGFAQRHAAAFSALCDRMALDYFQIDCAELPDGRLLVFEAAVAGIVHLMDPPDLFPYKPPQMRRVFAAFGAMLRQHASGGRA